MCAGRGADGALRRAVRAALGSAPGVPSAVPSIGVPTRGVGLTRPSLNHEKRFGAARDGPLGWIRSDPSDRVYHQPELGPKLWQLWRHSGGGQEVGPPTCAGFQAALCHVLRADRRIYKPPHGTWSTHLVDRQL